MLAIQDTSEINFRTTAERRRGLGEIGKGVGRGLLLHAMLALDADSHACLGLVAGQIWTRQGRVAVPHEKRLPQEKESWRWISTAERAKEVLSAAAMVTVIDDREGDIYAKWASVAGQNLHLLTRSMHDRALADGTGLYEMAARLPIADVSTIELKARANRPARQARLALRFGRVRLQRPRGPGMRDLPKTVELSVIEVTELASPPDVEPLHWYLLTTHEISDAASAWQIVTWYKKRWTIEQFFRILKPRGSRSKTVGSKPPIACLSLPRLPLKQPSSPYNLCRRVTAKALSLRASPSMKTKSSSTRSQALIRAERSCKAIRIRRPASPGPPGSSPGSAAGTDIRVRGLAP